MDGSDVIGSAGSAGIYGALIASSASLILAAFKMYLDYLREKRAKAEQVVVVGKIDDAAKLAAKSAEGVDHVAQELEQTKMEKAVKNAALDAKLDTAVATAVATHRLVNGKMLAQLQKNAALVRKLANLTQDPEHIIEAAAADKALADHVNNEKGTR